MDWWFWRNTIWYILLGVFTIFEVIFVLSRADRRLFAFAYFLSLTGVAFHVQVFLLTVFKAYDYFPMIIRTAPFDDALAGDVFSQFSVAATALLVCVLDLHLYTILLLVAGYAVVEEIFLATGSYTHNWYQTWMTMVLLLVFFVLARQLYRRIRRKLARPALFLLIAAGLFTLYVATVTWAFILSGYQNFSMTLLRDAPTSRSLLVLIHFFIVTFSMMYLYYRRPARPWIVAVVLAHYALNFAAYRTGLMYFANEWWYVLYTTVTLPWNYGSVALLDRMYRSGASRPPA